MGPNGLKSISICFNVAIVSVSGPTQKICGILALNVESGYLSLTPIVACLKA